LDRTGERNADFLNAQLFSDAFLGACEPYRDKVGLLMFEFGRFYQTDFPSVKEFAETLDMFLARLPKDWPYGVEIRNKHFLTPEYFAMLAKHGVAHVFNSWTDMPQVADQLALPGSITNPFLVGARFLLTPGRKYDESLKMFQPYDRIKAPDESVRAAGLLTRSGPAAAPLKRRDNGYIRDKLWIIKVA
jgi:hypothetical protein